MPYAARAAALPAGRHASPAWAACCRRCRLGLQRSSLSTAGPVVRCTRGCWRSFIAAATANAAEGVRSPRPAAVVICLLPADSQTERFTKAAGGTRLGSRPGCCGWCWGRSDSAAGAGGGTGSWGPVHAHLFFPLLYDGLGDALALLLELLQPLHPVCQQRLLGFPAGPQHSTTQRSMREAVRLHQAPELLMPADCCWLRCWRYRLQHVTHAVAEPVLAGICCWLLLSQLRPHRMSALRAATIALFFSAAMFSACCNQHSTSM